MKKSIVMTLIFALFLSVASSAFAVETRAVTAHINGVPETANTGDTLDVAISLTNNETGAAETAVMADFKVNYNADVLEYVEGSANTTYVDKGNGSLTLQYFGNASETFTLQFKVIGEKGTESAVTFVPTQLTTTGTIGLIPETTSVTVKVPGEEEPEENTTTDENTTEPTEPTEPEHKDPTGTGSETEEPEVDENGKPTKIPQTGVNFAVVGGVVIALVAVAAVAKKIND